MNERSDFYVMDHDDSMKWLGSTIRHGDPMNIPAEILIQGGEAMFEENVIDFLRLQFDDGIIKDDGAEWPWEWDDSKMTDYTYIFNVCAGKVLMSQMGDRLVDPIKIIQGMDSIGADVGLGLPNFPLMRDRAEELKKEIEKEYGSEST